MAKYAYRIPNGTEDDRVDAAELSLHDEGVFIVQHQGAGQECFYAPLKKQVLVL